MRSKAVCVFLMSADTEPGRQHKHLTTFDLCFPETSLFTMRASLDLFFVLRRVRALDALIPHSATAHTTPACPSAALSSY